MTKKRTKKAAVALGKAGGLARAKKLKPKTRKEIAKKAAAARWDTSKPKTEADKNQVAYAILNEPYMDYQWVLEYTSNGSPVKMISHSWPKTEEAVSLTEKLFGAPIEKSYGITYRGHALFVQNLVKTGKRMNRVSFLKSIRTVSRYGMMGNPVKAKLFMTWNCFKETWEKRIPAIDGYIDITVTWFLDGSIFLEVEEPSSDGKKIYDLYVRAGCDHKFESVQRGNCYYEYTCKKCGYKYSIDSSD